MKHPIALWTLALVCLSSTGCIIEDLVWLPDSSGFVYISDNRVMIYDIQTRQRREIVAAEWIGKAETGRPAISPDGKQIALVRCTPVVNSLSVQVLLYDLSGKCVREYSPKTVPSRPEPVVKLMLPRSWMPTAVSARERMAYAFWSPCGNRILIYAGEPSENRHRFTPSLMCYDLRNSTIQHFADLELPEECMMFEFSPFTPDGKEFLATRHNDDGFFADLELVDENGKRRPLRLSAEAEQALKAFQSALEKEKPCVRPEGRWDNGKLMIHPVMAGSALIDPQQGTITFQSDDPARKLQEYADKKNVQVCSVLEGGTVVQFHLAEPPELGTEKSAETTVPKEIASEPVETRHELLEFIGFPPSEFAMPVLRLIFRGLTWALTSKPAKVQSHTGPQGFSAAVPKDGSYRLIPITKDFAEFSTSPDRCYCVLRCFPYDDTPQHLVVVNQNGETVADLKL